MSFRKLLASEEELRRGGGHGQKLASLRPMGTWRVDGRIDFMSCVS